MHTFFAMLIYMICWFMTYFLLVENSWPDEKALFVSMFWPLFWLAILFGLILRVIRGDFT
jgi:hypothetical protein